MTEPSLGSWSHLARRFFEVLVSRPLSGDEVDWVARILDPAELAIFVSQGTADQRHGYAAGRHVEMSGWARDEVIRAALLHDVGKCHAALGIVGRVLASIALRLRIPVSGRFALYRDHDLLGAADLTRIGSPAAVVEYAATHHGRGSGTILSVPERRALDAADSPAIRLPLRPSV